MNAGNVLAAMLPSREQTWLLRACLHDGADGRAGWEAWRAVAGDARAAMAEDRYSVKRLLPALYSALRRNQADVDPALMPYLKLAYVREQMRSTTYLRICSEILARLEQAAVPVILLRGGALAVTAYGDPALRHCHDVALLVTDDNLEPATGALVSSGLTLLENQLRDGVAGAVLRHDTSLRVELHTRLFAVPSYQLPWRDVWPRTAVASIAGTPAHVLSPADALLHVCGHASYSASRESLRWVGDAWHLIRVNPALDWDSFCSTVERARLALPASVMLHYLAGDLGAPIPKHILDHLDSLASRAPKLERDIALLGARVGECAELGAFMRRTRGGWRTRGLAAWWLLFPSRQYVREVVGVRGSAQALLHYFARPAGYVRGRFSRQ